MAKTQYRYIMYIGYQVLYTYTQKYKIPILTTGNSYWSFDYYSTPELLIQNIVTACFNDDVEYSSWTSIKS